MTKALMIVTTYGPLKGGGGFGHDAKTPGAIKKDDRISTRGGLSDFELLLRKAVTTYKLRRGDSIEVTITPYTRSRRRNP